MGLPPSGSPCSDRESLTVLLEELREGPLRAALRHGQVAAPGPGHAGSQRAARARATGRLVTRPRPSREMGLSETRAPTVGTSNPPPGPAPDRRNRAAALPAAAVIQAERPPGPPAPRLPSHWQRVQPTVTAPAGRSEPDTEPLPV